MTGWDGADYRRVSSLQQWLAARALADVDLQGARSLLDVGCGDGRVTAQLAARLPGGSCVGLDPSPGMIAVAPTAPGLSFVVGDVVTMEYADAFDLVVSFNALHWVHDQAAALAAVAEALHRPGRALLVLVCAGPRPSLEDVAMGVTRRARWASAFEGFQAPYVHPDPEHWAALAGTAGLQVADLRVDDLSWDFATREAFTDWCTVGFGSWTSRLPPDHVEPFVAEVVEAYAEETGSDHVFRFMQLVGRLDRPAVPT
jgi:trans-aconitate 2-methyltransferase